MVSRRAHVAVNEKINGKKIKRNHHLSSAPVASKKRKMMVSKCAHGAVKAGEKVEKKINVNRHLSSAPSARRKKKMMVTRGAHSAVRYLEKVVKKYIKKINANTKKKGEGARYAIPLGILSIVSESEQTAQ
jgi:hypothetical protein